MASQFKHFRGIPELKAKFRALSDEAQKITVQAAAKEGGEVLLEAVKSTVPVDEGDLRNAEEMRIRKQRGAARAEIGADPKKLERRRGSSDKKAPHDRYIEFGTRHMVARAPLRKAFDNVHKRAADRSINEFKGLIRRHGGQA